MLFIQLYVMMITWCCSHLQIIQSLILQLKKEKTEEEKEAMKLYLQPDFVNQMTVWIKVYKKEIEDWHTQNEFDVSRDKTKREPCIHPPFSEDIHNTPGLAADFKDMAQDIMNILHIMAFNWENTKTLK